ncbi:MAG: NUDIX hydrolase [Pseudomonadota bacterium]
MKRQGQPPKRGQTYVRRPGVYAILPKNDSILATYQGGDHHEYQLPGGGIDPGESPLQALYREVLEETGWRITHPRVLGRYKRYTYMPEYDLWAEKICTIYTATPTYQIAEPTEPDHTPLWISYDAALMVLASSGDRDAICKFMSLGR